MKTIKNLVFLALFVAAATFAVSCGNSKSDGGKKGNDTTLMEGHKDSKEYTSAYICPMHCKDSGSDQPGKCPVCGMDYVAKADHDAKQHKH